MAHALGVRRTGVLRCANLNGAFFDRANLGNADLCGADSQWSDLIGASFRQAGVLRSALAGLLAESVGDYGRFDVCESMAD